MNNFRTHWQTRNYHRLNVSVGNLLRVKHKKNDWMLCKDKFLQYTPKPLNRNMLRDMEFVQIYQCSALPVGFVT